MTDDKELDRLMAQRLAEMKRNAQKRNETVPEKPKSLRDVLVSALGYRGIEVLEAAEKQFPRHTEIIVPQIANLIKSGEIPQSLDGGQLLAIFRLIGIPVRLQTSIRVQEDGKMVSLSKKISQR